MKFTALKFSQGSHELFVFTASAKEIWSFVEVNRRSDDKDKGYQRVLSDSRAEDIKKFLEADNAVPPAIIVAFDEGKAEFEHENSQLVIEDVPDAGWVIDGQHRLKGAELVEFDVELAVVAFLNLSLEEQIQQFVTINREGKGVPTSLYYDLLTYLPRKKPGDIAKEKAAAIAERLRKDRESLFFDRIVVVTAPKSALGQMSLNNFVRKVSPLILEGKGALSAYSQQEVTTIIENYFKALKAVFPEEFSLTKYRFFKTLGFGAVMNALPAIFLLTLKEYNGFRIEDIIKILEKASDFHFDNWDSIGTGSAAENMAGRDFEAYLKARVQESEDKNILRL